MRLSSLAVAATLAWTLTGSTIAAGDLWVTDFEKAKQTAAKEGKDLLMDFTGSDWCGWCIKLRKEVFDQDAFKTAGPKSFVLVEIDFPQDTKKLSKETQEQNTRLGEQFEVRGYPSIILADAQGRPYAQTGYQAGGPDKYLKHLGELREVRVKRDEEWKKADGAQGVEKAKHLAAGLKLLDPDLASKHYAKVITEITSLDAKDETGVGASMTFKADLAKLQTDLAQVAGKDGSGGARKAAGDFIAARPKLTADQKQMTLMSLLGFYKPPQDNETVLKLMDEVKKIDPRSEAGKQASQIEVAVKQMIEKAKSGKPAAK